MPAAANVASLHVTIGVGPVHVMSDCLFCRIADGTISAEIVFEDDLVVACLDIGPIRPGHTQIIPRKHHPYFDDVPEPTAARILQVG